MKKIFAAAALATTLAAGAAVAAQDETMIPVDFSVTTDSQPAIDKQGNLVLDQDGSPKFEETRSYSIKSRTASACVADTKGGQFTVDIEYILAASAPDLGIDPAQAEADKDAAIAQIAEKFPGAKADEAAAYVAQAWQKVASGHKLEEILGAQSPQSFVADLRQTFTDLINDKRLDANTPSYEERSGVTIAALGIHPVNVTRGCKP
jgi:hypothetical protein